jgi:hypothetical protein
VPRNLRRLRPASQTADQYSGLIARTTTGIGPVLAGATSRGAGVVGRPAHLPGTDAFYSTPSTRRLLLDAFYSTPKSLMLGDDDARTPCGDEPLAQALGIMFRASGG